MGLRLLGVQLFSGLMFRDVLLMGLGAGGMTGHRCASGAYGLGSIGACGFGGMWEVQVCACSTLYMTPHVTNIARFKA